MEEGPRSAKARSDHYLGRMDVLEDVMKHLMSNMRALNDAQAVIDAAHSDKARLEACSEYIRKVHAGYNRIQQWALDGVDEAVGEIDVIKAELKRFSGD
ncbi:hypothetical protein [Brevundimonas mediterranea]|uniref:Uncharacterized protein n=1 Tax=Brevundimonas mediterranea TaxID=74329 RepID=A0A7W6EZV0_9CAUL|nr:hypothetical protein [Brevundimonas mediterranea]MBB3872320.1 hypothetical protein [Brevundimonas mediterranea]